MEDHSIILFDGVCNLCNRFVVFVIRKDTKIKFKFASLQSEVGKRIEESIDIESEESPNSVVFVDKNKYYVKSDAVLRIVKELGGVWSLSYFLFIVPRPIRDFFYDMVAKNRYRLFGRKFHCMVPNSDLKERFL